jgi:hypothetical protein
MRRYTTDAHAAHAAHGVNVHARQTGTLPVVLSLPSTGTGGLLIALAVAAT